MQLAGPTEHKVLPCTQQKADREQATNFFESIKEDTPLASAGAVGDSTSGNEVLWLSIAKDYQGLAKDTLQIANEKFTAAGGTGASGTRSADAAGDARCVKVAMQDFEAPKYWGGGRAEGVSRPLPDSGWGGGGMRAAALPSPHRAPCAAGVPRPRAP